MVFAAHIHDVALRTLFVTVVCACALFGQQPTGTPPAAMEAPSLTGSGAGALGMAPITLAEAIERARKYSPQFLAAATAAGVARESSIQAKAALLPTLTAFNQYIYTQGNQTPSGIFVANNGVHEYGEQAIVHADVFSVAKRAEYQGALAAEAVARARREIASRGLVATVVQAYYGLVTAQRHEANAGRSEYEARHFLDITRKLEQGGEAAHADVVKAELQFQQRERELVDSNANTIRARIALGVMILANPESEFQIEDDLGTTLPLEPLPEIRAAALTNSPEVRAAEAALKESTAAIATARAAYYPTFGIDYFFGIDANTFSTEDPKGRNNLGSVVQGTVTVPVWNWGATRSRIRQSELAQRQAEFGLEYARRSLEANLSSFYLEAQTAEQEMESLRSSVALAVESLRLTLLRYEAGEATALEVVDAQTSQAQTRNAFDDGLSRYRVALANIQILTGRL